MSGVQTILNTGWKDERIYVPPGFIENAWNLFLPKGILSILLSVMTYIIRGYNKQEILEQMKIEEKQLALTPFSFQTAPMLLADEEKQVYLQLLRRETGVRKILERSGFFYPATVEESIQLLVSLGILLEIEKQDGVYYDVVLHPFPLPEERLILTEQEMEEMNRYRNSQKSAKHSGEDNEDWRRTK
jgi:hypothetical protein